MTNFKSRCLLLDITGVKRTKWRCSCSDPAERAVRGGKHRFLNLVEWLFKLFATSSGKGILDDGIHLVFRISLDGEVIILNSVDTKES